MMRIVVIISVLSVAIIALLMSVCGGFFVFVGAWQGLQSMMSRGRTPFDSLPTILMGIPFLVAGGTVFWLACRYVWREVSQKDSDKTD